MLNKLQYEWKDRAIFYLAIAMLCGLFLSRVALSVTITGFVLASFFHGDIKGQLRNFFSIPLLWSMGLLFMIPLITGLWSSDQQQWLTMMRIKLPLLFLPLAFAGPVSILYKRATSIAVFFLLLIAAATLWSMYHYSLDMRSVNEGYLQSKTLLTPLQNDHVRFSWLVSLAVFLCGVLLWKKVFAEKNANIGLLLLIGWLIIYLHLLAARTGLFCLYGMIGMTALWFVIKKARPLAAAALLLALLILPLLAYTLLPSFRNRVKYIYYDYGYFKEAHYLPGGNDAGRVISLKAGWQVMLDHPTKGVGFGDILPVTVSWYDNNYPGMRPADKIYPSSEWLMFGTGAGVAGFIFFTSILLLPFFIKKINYRPAWLLLNAMIVSGMLFDIGLETQFGVFIYSFTLLWTWKWFAGKA